MLQIKTQLINEVLQHLQTELNQAIKAANNAHNDAVDDQSVAETQYDTLAIEASYLAEGQSKRVLEYQQAIKIYHVLQKTQQSITLVNNERVDHRAKLGSLVQLDKDKECDHWFFIGPFAGGFRTNINEYQITVITPKSPMGMAIKDKQQDDDVEITLGNEKLHDYICAVH